MNSFLSALTLFGKLSLLGCFSLFGGQCGISEAATESPCHVKVAENILEKNTTKPCGQCEHSISAWSEPIVHVSLIQKEIPRTFSFPLEEKKLSINIDGTIVSPAIVPPDGLIGKEFKRVAKSIFWQSSACFFT